MTDGGNWHRPPPGPGSPWWSDALHDPWRDPYAPAAVVLPAPAPTGGPALDPVPDPDAPRRSYAPVLLICLLTALLAGGVGGTLGFVFAVRGGYVGAGGTRLGAAGQQSPVSAARDPQSLAGVAKKLQPSVVTVHVTGAIGSGFVVSADGYVITNDHVVDGAGPTMSVSFSDGSTAAAKLVGRDPESDIAVIKIAKGNLPAVPFGDSDAIAVGDPVLAFGSPLALENTVTYGIVSALDRTIEAGESGGTTRYYAAIQTDAAVNQGNSGGPLVNAAGQVIGVNSVIRSVGGSETEAGNIGLAFAIPINQAKRIAQDIIDTGKARRTVIGAEVTSGGTGTSGAKLRSVEPAGPAAAAGLKAGDVITKLDGRPLQDGTDLIALVRKHAPGAVVAVEYRRGSKTVSASVTLSSSTN
ncbi:peptidase S1 [Actinoplanes sp. SE50]|uniref:S1C family serine protease n=1 Tax=unclassified Actinoplanes TaxID=2626549 RepID=UPI00023EDE64|nr:MULTISPECIES: trypsin-like peptidase domain-containing protein [unclassified Actinoplanes]AEV88721.1 peptidase S1 and S6 chymotrypsin/Hap [Actinoplanes sp. SE50/110]ATO87125.1 peptidase S1 [Actinoplanes sp. SE50]SLM04543.1 peptidase S1 [Actinoplanes sp. SE50/110]